MEVLVIGFMFLAVALAGCVVAAVLIARAIRDDWRDEARAEHQAASGSQPAWVGAE